MLFSKRNKGKPRDQPQPLFSLDNLPVFLLLAVLSYVTVWTFSGLDFTTGDDAGWFRHSADRHAREKIVRNWATSQGRIFAYVLGSMMVYANSWSTTPFGEFLKFAPYFFACFCYAIAIHAYFGQRLALLTLTLLLGLMALRFDMSAVTAYPLLMFPNVALVLLSVVAMRRYALKGRTPALVLAMTLLFLSYWAHESITLLGIAIGGLAVVANLSATDRRLSPSLRFSDFTRRGRALFLGYVGITLLYATIYLSYQALYPSTYEGHIADFSRLDASLRVLAYFGLNGSVLFGFWDPYVVHYVFPPLYAGLRIAYGPVTDFATTFANPLAILFGLTAGASFWLKVKSPAPTPASSGETDGIPLGFAIPPAIAFIVAPVMLLAVSSKYLDWHEKFGVDAYASTCVSLFGVALLLAVLTISTLRLFSKWPAGQLTAAAVISVGVGLLAATNQNINSEIASDHRHQAARWEAYERGLALIRENGLDIEHLYLPQYLSGSWHGMPPLEDWRTFASRHHGMDVEVYERPLLPLFEGGAASMTFWPDAEGRNPVVIVAKFDLSDPHQPSLSALAIDARSRDAKERRRLVLSYVGYDSGPRQFLLDRLPPAGPDEPMLLRNLNIVPATVHLQEIPLGSPVIIECGESVPPDVDLVFGSDDRPMRPSCSMANQLNQSWFPPERHGAWSNAKEATVNLPRLNSGPEGVRLTFFMDTLASRGSLPEAQRVTVSSGNDVFGAAVFSRDPREGSNVLSFGIPPERAVSLRSLTLTVEDPANLKERGISQDDRLLGVYLRKIRIQPLSQ